MTVELVPPSQIRPTAAVAAGFEAGMLLRCARTGGPRDARRAGLVEFNRAAAADRLLALLAELDLPGHDDTFVAGGWHRYTVHRVVCADLDGPVVAAAWRIGYQRLCSVDSYRSVRQRQHRAELAQAAWRAALLAGGLRTGGGPLAVRVAEDELAVALVRAGRVLEAPVVLRTRGGRHLVEIAPGPRGEVLRGLALAG